MGDLRVGLFLNAAPDGGGTYQYNLSVMRALESLPAKTQLIGFAAKPWDLPGRFQLVNCPISRWERAIGRLIRAVFGIHVLRAMAPIVYRAVRKMNHSGCDVIIFPSQDLYACLVTTRALAAIHDLMHRYHPGFAEYSGGDARQRDLLYAGICRYAAGILVDSPTGKKHVTECYGRERNVFPLPFVPPFYLQETAQVDVKGRYGLPERYVFYPAQFWEHKNHLKLIQAVALLRDRGIKVNLVLCGAKKQGYDAAMRLVSLLHLEEQIFVLGYVSNDEMASLYRSAEALVFVSLIGPTNIPPLEAMLLGCPVIVSDRYAMPEQVGDAGILVDPGNAQDIARGILEVWENEALREKMRQRGYKRVSGWTQKEFSGELSRILDVVGE